MYIKLVYLLFYYWIVRFDNYLKSIYFLWWLMKLMFIKVRDKVIVWIERLIDVYDYNLYI